MTKLEELHSKMVQVHDKAQSLFEMDNVPSMLKNEYRNKVSQYDNMYDSIETMKGLTSKEDTLENLINQQIEILNVRIKWELDWTKRVIERL
ncbi:hypothetical protein SAMN02910377_01245 [Pseudobutyrivibrio ruminis]|uniref:Uncharacterized protein n=1 Tax=Pseudobutyrivibrio ruminis TaxID=46206 RepID=A0A1H7I827_9FIRM|nr:hypothetical protein [Pseudobutyrivibrio ruminis]SEK58656.1 hypothetical protein SAMN02910377_01245 [Pseudobutyrivibrio ruminis]